jgi:hypothetical protein
MTELPVPSLILKTPVTLGEPQFVEDLTKRAEGWRRTIRRQGGYWLGEFRLRGERDYLERFFHEYLGYHFEEYSNGRKTWEGLIYTMELTSGGVTRRRSLDEMVNDVGCTYIDAEDRVQVSARVTNAASIARYGRRQELLLLDGFSQQAAELRRDVFLREHAWPWARTVGHDWDGEDELVVIPAGYIFTANHLFESVAGLDGNQGALAYVGAQFEDLGQDFGEWKSTAAPARYLIWVKNDDGSVSWAYLGNTVSATLILTYEDAALTTLGWNGDATTDKTPESYSIYGPVSEWVRDVIVNDCPFLQIGKIAENLTPTRSENKTALRAWDVLLMLAELGGPGGEPWRLYVDNERRVYYEPVDTNPVYYQRDGDLYSSIGGALAVNPWEVRPGVVRDLQYGVGQGEPGGWLADRRDFYVSEVEASVGSERPVFNPDIFYEGNLLATQQSYAKLLEKRQAEDKKKSSAPSEAKSKTKGRRWKNT